MSYRFLMIGGATVRAAYGLGALLAPERMVAAELLPDTHGAADPRLLGRAFGGHQLVVGGLALAALRRRRLGGPAAALSLLIDASDVASALLELGARGRADRTTVGGIAFSSLGVATFAAALLAHGRGR